MRGFIALWFIIWTSLVLVFFATSGKAAVPQRAEQPHPDTFQVNGQDLAQFNKVTIKAKQVRTLTYRYSVASGCTKGTTQTDMEAVFMDAAINWGILNVRNDTAFDYSVTVNCGNTQVSNCGGINIFCVRGGSVYYGNTPQPDVSMSDIINTYPAVSRRSIFCHEICGHVWGTWEEQYCKGIETTGVCKGLPQFSSTPNWPDIMNTGADSRHDISIIENERWDRTMWPVLAVTAPTPWCCDTVYAGWEGMGVARFNSDLAAWYWGIPQRNGAEFLYRWRNASEGWQCIQSCPK